MAYLNLKFRYLISLNVSSFLKISNSDIRVTHRTIVTSLRTIVTGQQARCILGRGDKAVNDIRDESGAKIKIERSSQTGKERIITVDGHTDSIFKVLYLRYSEILAIGSDLISTICAGLHPDM